MLSAGNHANRSALETVKQLVRSDLSMLTVRLALLGMVFVTGFLAPAEPSGQAQAMVPAVLGSTLTEHLPWSNFGNLGLSLHRVALKTVASSVKRSARGRRVLQSRRITANSFGSVFVGPRHSLHPAVTKTARPSPVRSRYVRRRYPVAIRSVRGTRDGRFPGKDGASSTPPACTISWNTNQSGFWDVASNWDANRVPNSSDDVCIDRGSANPTVTIRSDASVNSLFSHDALVQTSGTTLNLAAASEFFGAFHLEGGMLQASTSIVLAGTTTSSGGEMDNFTNTGALTVDAAGLTVGGGVQTNSGKITLSPKALVKGAGILTNTAKGIIDMSDGSQLESTGNDHFVNDGLIRKSSGAGTAVVGDTSGNSNGINADQPTSYEVDSGTLQFAAVGTWTDGGTFTVAKGARLLFSLPGSPLSPLSLSGTFTSSGGGRIENPDETFRPIGGLPAPVLAFPAGMFDIDGGALGGSMKNVGTVTVSGVAGGEFNGGAFENAGTLVFSGATPVTLSTAIQNDPTATIDLQGDPSFQGGGGIENRGTIEKSAGTGTAQFQVGSFDNSGTVSASSGTLSLANVVQSSPPALTGGTWDVSNGATLDIGTNPLTQNEADVSLVGAGSSISNLSQLTQNSGHLQLVQGASFTTTGDLTNSGTITLGISSLLNVQGAYSQSSDAVLETSIAGAPSNGEFGTLAASGKANLDGTIVAAVAPGFKPGLGDSYRIVDASSRTGRFTSAKGTDLSGGLSLNDVYDPTGMSFDTDSSRDKLPDLSVDTVSMPASGTVGDAVTVRFHVTNAGDATAAGTWRDSVYLSSDQSFDPSSDVLIGRVSRAGPLAPGAGFNAQVTGAVPAVLPGRYYVIVAADSQNDLPDSNRANNVDVSAQQIAVGMRDLQPRQVVHGTIGGGQDAYYQFSPSDPGATFHLVATFAGPPASGTLYERYAAVPSPSAYDQTAADPLAVDQQVLVSGAQGGTYIVLIHGRSGAASPQSYSLSLDVETFGVDSFTPSGGSNIGKTTVTITGAGFTPHASVTLEGSGQSVPAASTMFVDDHTLYATFDLATGPVQPGPYALMVNDQGRSAASAGTFIVAAGGQAGGLTFQLITPGFVRPQRQGVVEVDYQNTGTTDVPAPMMILLATGISFCGGFGAGVGGEPASGARGASRAVSQGIGAIACFAPPTFVAGEPILATAKSGPAGVLPPGGSGAAQFVFRNLTPADGYMTFSLYAAEENDLAQPLDWASLKDGMRPAAVSARAWDVDWANFMSQTGTTLGSFQDMLDRNATYLGSLGERTTDMNRLVFLELQRADDFGDISARYDSGAFGMGIPDPTMTATTDAQGNVTIEGGGVTRDFIKNADGSFVASMPGDHGILTSLSSGGYTLRETTSSRWTFGSDGKAQTFIDPNGNTTTAQYSAGRLTGFVDFSGDRETFSYDTKGRIVKAVNPVGVETDYSYDASHHLISEADPSGTMRLSWNPASDGAAAYALASATFPDGTTQQFHYDANGRMTQIDSGNGQLPITYTYNADGSITGTSPEGQSDTYYLNENGRVVKALDPLGTLETYGYGADNRLSSASIAGRTSTFSYDAIGDPTQFADPLGDTMKSTFDQSFARPTSITDPRGLTTSITLDAHGNPTTIQLPDRSRERFGYDAQGDVVRATDEAGKTTRVQYDMHGLPTSETLGDGSTVTFTYDLHRNLLSVTGAQGTTSFTYDGADRLTSVTYPNGLSLRYQYDSGGRETELQTSDGFTEKFSYDHLGRLSQVTSGGGNAIATYQYDTAGRMSKQIFGNGTSTSYGYNSLGLLTNVTDLGAGGATLMEQHSTYDSLGQLASVTDSSGTTTYEHDAAGRITAVHLPGGHDITYQLDSSGNRVQVVDQGQAASYATNRVDEYTSAGDTAYQYDPEGDLIRQTDSTGTTTYGYDASGQLKSMTTPSHVYTYEYDALGNRIGETVDGQITRLLTDPTNSDLLGQYDASNNALDHYGYGLGLAAQFPAGAKPDYYFFDERGNTSALTDSSGRVLDTYSYLPYGELRSSSGSAPNPFTFLGKFGVSNDGGGLMHDGAREYAPALGRFISRDPISRLGVNPYTYSANDPVDLFDANGLQQRSVSDTWVGGPYYSNAIKTVNTSVGQVATAVQNSAYAVGSNIARDPRIPQGAWEASVATASNSKSILSAGNSMYLAPSATTYARMGRILNYTRPVGSFFMWLGVAKELNQAYHGKDVYDVVRHSAAGFLKAVVRVPFAGQLIDTLSDVWDVTTASACHEMFDWYYGNNKPMFTLQQYMAAELHRLAQKKLLSKSSGDPNDIVGPLGPGAAQYVGPRQNMPYQINFENKPTADLPAQTVSVTERLNRHLDLSRFQLGPVGFGTHFWSPPPGAQSFDTLIDDTRVSSLDVRVTGALDAETRTVTWTFTSIDPKTGDFPADQAAGFLPPDKHAPFGEGFVTYSTRPTRGLKTGARISAKATVVFDQNPAIGTNTFVNTVDATAPVPAIVSLPPIVQSDPFDVRWKARDGASGVSLYDVIVQKRKRLGPLGPAIPLKVATSSRAAAFRGSPGTTYCFSARATDAVGNTSSFSPPRCTTVPLNARALKRQGAWHLIKVQQAYFHTLLRTTRKGASLSAPLGGKVKEIGVLVERCPTCGAIHVLLGHRVLKTLSLAGQSGFEILLVDLPHTQQGRVSIKVVSAGRMVLIDGLGIAPPIPRPPTTALGR